MFADLRRRARALEVPRGIPGAVTSIQFGGSFATANLHFHTLIPEGLWQEQADGSVTFHPLPPPTDDDVLAITMRIVRGVARLLQRRGDADGDADAPDALDQARAEALKLPVSSGPSARIPITTSTRRRAAIVDGFSLHADTSVDASDRLGLERLARYILRPIITADASGVRASRRTDRDGLHGPGVSRPPDQGGISPDSIDSARVGVFGGVVELDQEAGVRQLDKIGGVEGRQLLGYINPVELEPAVLAERQVAEPLADEGEGLIADNSAERL